MSTRTVFVVSTGEGYLGGKRYSYAEGTYSKADVKFKHARIFTRHMDAEAACVVKHWKVLEAKVSV